MAESKESNNNGFGDIIESIQSFKDEFLKFLDEIKKSINDTLHINLFKIQEETKDSLNELEKLVKKMNEDNLGNKKIDEGEKEMFDELCNKNKILKEYFDWIVDDSIDEDLLNSEKENLLELVKEYSDNDKDSKLDLNQKELDKIISTFKYKYDLLKSVLEDDKIKNKEPKPSKKDILEAYNNYLKDKKEPPKKDDIIKILTEPQQSNS